MDRPWELDPFPLVLAPEEWAQVRAALEQRARVLDAVLADVYGPQRLLRENLLPADLVFSHPGYLRPLHGPATNQSSLQLYAPNPARAPPGRWRQLCDTTTAPSGSPYALANL